MATTNDTGDGDRCPTHPAHGHMFVYGKRQFCPHNEHDKGERSRCFWPLYGAEEEASSDAAQAATGLPDIDISGLEF